MGVTVKTTVDLKGFKQIAEAIKRTNKRVRVGVLKSEGGESEVEDGDLSLIELAAIHEFGSPEAGIPERSFLRSTFNKTDQIRTAVEDIVGGEVKKLLSAEKAVTSGQAEAAARRALGKLGAAVVGMIKQTVRDRETVGPEPQELKPATIARKGSDLPLVDTAQLLNALTWVVVDPKDDDE